MSALQTCKQSKMPELTEVLPNKPAEEAEKNDSDTESGSDDSIPELEDTVRDL